MPGRHKAAKSIPDFYLALAGHTAAGLLLLVHLDALMAGIHMRQEVLGSVKLARDALHAHAEGADPIAGSQVARVLHQT